MFDTNRIWIFLALVLFLIPFGYVYYNARTLMHRQHHPSSIDMVQNGDE